jgi:hypothetical protein
MVDKDRHDIPTRIDEYILMVLVLNRVHYNLHNHHHLVLQELYLDDMVFDNCVLHKVTASHKTGYIWLQNLDKVFSQNDVKNNVVQPIEHI